MHILIDARRINSSTGHYAERLIDHLQKIPDKNTYTIVVLEKEADYYKLVDPRFRIVTTTADHYTFGEQLLLAALLYRLKPDLVHFTMPQQPLLWFGRRVTTIHDTTLIRYENVDMNPIIYRTRRLIFTVLMRNVIWRSRQIIVPTNFVKNDLNEWTGGRYTDKFVVTHESGDMIHTKPEAIRDLAGKKYLFYVGNAFPYKNLWRIVDAYRELLMTYPDLHLALAGKRDYFYDQLAQRIEAEHIKNVHLLGYISDGEKRWAMQNAEVYVVASLSEGFNIPLQEAMHERCPVVASDASCLPEVAGKGAVYFDPHSTDSLTKKLREVMGSASLRKKIIDEGQKQIAKFSWQKMTRETRAVYLDALR